MYPSFCWGAKPPMKFSKREGGLDRTSILRGGCWERGDNFFQEGCNFYVKNQLKSEIFNDKKNVYTKVVFLCHS